MKAAGAPQLIRFSASDGFDQLLRAQHPGDSCVTNDRGDPEKSDP
jgi:hypothetical protein